MLDTRDNAMPQEAQEVLWPATAEPKWHVVWTRSHCEQLVYEQFSRKGYHLFLPMIDVWARRRGRREHERVPMFPGYLFLRHAVDPISYLDLARSCKSPGVVKLLGRQWDHLAEVPAAQVHALQKVHQAGLPARAHLYPREGERVRITGGLLEGAEGILLRKNPHKGLLVVSIDILQRSVAVEVDCTLVAPA